jgi:hypothetical protein
MRVRVVVPATDGERLREQLLALAEKVEKEEKGETWETVCILIVRCLLFDLTELSRLCSLNPPESVQSMNCCRKRARERGVLRRLPLLRPLIVVKSSFITDTSSLVCMTGQSPYF